MKEIKRTHYFSLSTLLVSFIFSISLANAKTQELKFSSALPQNSPSAKQVERMVETVLTESNNALKIVPYYSSQLGSETAVLSQIARGRVEMGQFTTASVALQFPVIALAQMPLYFLNSEERDCVLDNHLLEPVREMLATKNMHMLFWGEVGTLNLPGVKSFTSPDDIKGLKVGIVSQKINNEFWKMMGANPVSTHVAEVASSLQTGLIDTNPLPYVVYVPAGINKIAPVITKIKLWDASGIFMMNKRVYDRLPQASKDALATHSKLYPASLIRKETRQLEAVLEKKHLSSGGKVVEPTEQEIKLWRNSLKDFYSNMAKELGEEGERFFALMESGKQQCNSSK